MKNIEKIVKELDAIQSDIRGWSVPKSLEIVVAQRINNIKSFLNVEEKHVDNIVFEMENDKASCRIIKRIGDVFIFHIYDKNEDYLIDSTDPDGDELAYDGVFPTLELCKKTMKEVYKCWIGGELNI